MSIVRSSKHLAPPLGDPRQLTTPAIACALAVMLLSGCASPSVREDVSATASAPTPVMYTVERGDRLSDIAQRFTGNVDSWKAIAAANSIDDPRKLRVGTVIEIPAELLAEEAIVDTADPAESVSQNTTDASVNLPRAVSSRDIDAAQESAADARINRMRAQPVPIVLATRATPVEEAATPDVELNAVDVNRSFELSPLDGQTTRLRADTSTSASDAADNIVVTRLKDSRATSVTGKSQVRVLGSYFPKGIYAQPASYSELIMRVAPGTLFILEERVGDWYGVVTEQGIGYLRDTDVRVIETNEESAAALRG